MASSRIAAAALLAFAGAAAANAAADRATGERIYRTGMNARGEPIRALLGLPPTPLAGEPAACIACHDLDARSAADLAPDLRWSTLAATRGGARYDDRLFARAVNEGLDVSGAPVGNAMPRYSLSRSELAALAAFLRSLPADKKK